MSNPVGGCTHPCILIHSTSPNSRRVHRHSSRH
jgi:hypothetical protein